MKNETNFEVFLFLSEKKITLSVISKTDFELIFQEEFFFENNSLYFNFEKLDFFLNENVIKVEKILSRFIESLNIIINSKEFFNLQISVKKIIITKKLILILLTI